MNNQVNNNELKQAVLFLRERMETIRINLEILEALKLSGWIKNTDKKYHEIIGLDGKSRKSFNELVLNDLPGLIEADFEPGSKQLKKSLLDWAADLNLSLGYLDLIIKDYMHQIAVADQGLNNLDVPDVKDKRFWKFLDKAKVKTRLFESFEEPEHTDGSDQVEDPEKGIKEQQREKE